VEQILKVNQQLLAELQKTAAEGTIGKVFKTMGHFLKLYTVYINSYEQAHELFGKLTKKENKQYSKFQDFLQQAFLDPILKKNNFGSLHILPVQRVPRYVLLLKAALEVTADNHPDFNDLKEALDIVSVIAKFVNESKRTNEESNILLELSSKIKNKYSVRI
jgi:hypothetical protein